MVDIVIQKCKLLNNRARANVYCPNNLACMLWYNYYSELHSYIIEKVAHWMTQTLKCYIDNSSLTGGHAGTGGRVGTTTGPPRTIMSGSLTSPKFWVNGMHQTAKKSMSWTVTSLGSLSVKVRLWYSPRPSVLQGKVGLVYQKYANNYMHVILRAQCIGSINFIIIMWGCNCMRSRPTGQRPHTITTEYNLIKSPPTVL